MQNVLLVAERDNLKSIFDREQLSDFKVVSYCSRKEEAISYLEANNKAVNIVLLAEGTPSSGMTTLSLIMEIRRKWPNIRIVFFSGEFIPSDTVKAAMLSDIVKAGVYDIIPGSRPNVTEFITVMNKPRTYVEAKIYVLDNTPKKQDTTGILKNVISFYSVKPGSGKSFLAYNTAVAIAKFGQEKSNGKKPRVALIDGDLNSLSIGALMHMGNSNRNLREALKLAGQVVDTNGNVIGTQEALAETKKEIRQCFIRHPEITNLYAMVASEFPLSERIAINPRQFYFFMECIYEAFDIVIVDMNSSLEHTTTGPLFALSNRIYFLLDPDFNNIVNNKRYQQDLVALGVNSKTRYIMNKYLSKQQQEEFTAMLDYNVGDIRSSGIDIVGTVAMVDPIIMNNRAMSGSPLVLDTPPFTAESEQAIKDILRLANENWKINQKAVKAYQYPETKTTSTKGVAAKGLGFIDKIKAMLGLIPKEESKN